MEFMLRSSSPTPSGKPSLSVKIALMEALAGFKSWWIAPMCLVTAVLFFFQSQWTRLFFNDEDFAFIRPYRVACQQLKQEAGRLNPNALENFQATLWSLLEDPAARESFERFLSKVVRVLFILVLILCPLRVFLIILSREAVGDHRGKTKISRDFKRSAWLSLSYFLLALVQVLAFFFFFFPGLYLYARLYLAGYLISEESADPFAAAAQSWKMTRSTVWEILALILIGFVVNIIEVVTIVGAIPGEAFLSALRASAYKQLKAPPHRASEN